MFFKNEDARSGHQYDHCFSALQYFYSGEGGCNHNSIVHAETLTFCFITYILWQTLEFGNR